MIMMLIASMMMMVIVTIFVSKLFAALIILLAGFSLRRRLSWHLINFPLELITSGALFSDLRTGRKTCFLRDISVCQYILNVKCLNVLNFKRSLSVCDSMSIHFCVCVCVGGPREI